MLIDARKTGAVPKPCPDWEAAEGLPVADPVRCAVITIPFATGILPSRPCAYNPYIALRERDFDIVLF